jgi:signal transduction histidine kinase
MPVSLASRVSVSIVGVIVLAVVSSMSALLSSWHVGNLMHRTVSENLASVRAAEGLETALLEQRGFVSSYILGGGDRKWLVDLEKRKRGFRGWLDRAHKTANTSTQREILRELDGVYEQYDAKRDQVVGLYDRGEIATAQRQFVQEINQIYGQAYELCERFISANQQSVDAAVTGARRQIRRITLAVGVCVALTIGLGMVLLWLFFYGVIFPLRVMIEDARKFAGEESAEANKRPADELRAMGIYLHNLMSDVAGTRTTLERSQSELREAEKLASVGKLAASVAHEIRNPLTSLKMWLFSIRKYVGGDPALDRKFEIVAEEICRLESIVQNFLEFSRLPELRLSVEPISTLVAKTLELTEPQIMDRQIRLLHQNTPGLPPVLADSEQLRQVLLNLLKNAVEATSPGGRIRVSTSAEVDAEGRTMVVVRVSDTGPGMTEETRQRIFEPFFSTKDEGTGLGLCIAARIMVRHQGRLVLESSSHQGTTFAIHIPAAATEET